MDMRKYSFSQRVINEWNKLSNDCVNASSVKIVKNEIDRYLVRAGYTLMMNRMGIFTYQRYYNAAYQLYSIFY